MRFIKLFFVGLVGLFVFVTLFSLLIPAHIKVSRAVIIHASTDQVYNQLSDLKNWSNWHPAFKNNAVHISFPDSSGNKQVSCDILSDGKEAHLRITHIDSISIQFLLQANGENDISNEILITPIREQNALQVEWKALISLHWYPWEKFYGIFIDKITGPGYEEALNGLKAFVENE